MDNYYAMTGQNEIKPGGNIAFGGGFSNRNRRANSIPYELTDKINCLYNDFVLMGRNSNEIFYLLGVLGSNLKDIAGHGNFEKLRKQRFPHIRMRTLQRAMKIANFFYFTQHPAFLLIPRSQLYRIAQRFNDMEQVVNILESNKIDLDVNENDEEHIKCFLEKINMLTSGKLSDPENDEEDVNKPWIKKENGWTVVGINEEPDSNGDNNSNSTTGPLESLLDRIRAEREYYKECELLLPKEDVQIFSEIMREITSIFEFYGPETILPRDISTLSTLINRISRIP